MKACKPDSAMTFAGAVCMHITEVSEPMLCHKDVPLASSLVTHSAVHLFANAGKMGRRMDNIVEKHTQGFFIRTPATSPHKTATAPQTNGRGRAQPWERVLPAKAPPSQRAQAATHRAHRRAKKTLSAKSHGSDLLLV